VRTAKLLPPRIAPPVGLLRFRLTVSRFSTSVSLMIEIVNVLLVSPTLKFRVPFVAV